MSPTDQSLPYKKKKKSGGGLQTSRGGVFRIRETPEGYSLGVNDVYQTPSWPRPQNRRGKQKLFKGKGELEDSIPLSGRMKKDGDYNDILYLEIKEYIQVTLMTMSGDGGPNCWWSCAQSLHVQYPSYIIHNCGNLCWSLLEYSLHCLREIV